MVRSWKADADEEAWQALLEKSREPREPVDFQVAENPATECPAYLCVVRDYHRCAANDVPPWEKFEDSSMFEPGVATCGQCNWPKAEGRT